MRSSAMMNEVYGRMRGIEKKTMREQISSGRTFGTHIRNSYDLINKLSRLRPSAVHGLAKNNVQTSFANAAVLRDLYLTQALVWVCRGRVKFCVEARLFFEGNT